MASLELEDIDPVVDGTGWDWGDRALYCAHVAWMVKEIGWVLLIPEISLPSGFIAALLVVFGLALHLRRRRFAANLCELVMGIWLCSNVLWMTSEVLFDDPDVKFPWHLVPVLEGDHEFTYDVLSSISAKGFFAAVLLYVVGLAVLFHPSCRERGVVGNTLLQCYLCSWCLKDYFWAEEEFWPAICTDLITVPMLLYNIHIETTLRGSHWRQFAWVSWSLANGVWIIGELKFPGVMEFNISAAILLLIALVLLVCGYDIYKETEQKNVCLDDSCPESDGSTEISAA